MNEFMMYEILCALEGVVSKYPSGQEILQKIQYTKELVSTRKYRIAVIGMFKCGKSTLINALVGSSILPTDVVPTTAVLNRIVYGNTKQISICYQNGQVERHSIEELSQYATKESTQGGIRASEIKEIIVEYPSVFCQNRIEIIDTPGLNDDERMTQTTISVLDEIDSAIVTISALQPLSLTEQQLVKSLIRQQGIRHITFVITFIDQASRRASDQDKIIAFIRKRLQTEVLSYVEEQVSDDPKLLQKARDILTEPTLFAVSAVLALKGFEYDDPELLEKSRFPRFKQELFDLLISNQSEDMHNLTTECVRETDLNLSSWYFEQLNKLNQNSQGIEKQSESRTNYFNQVDQYLQQIFIKTDQICSSLIPSGDNPLDSDMIRGCLQQLRRCFITELGSLRAGNDTDAAVRQCLKMASSNGAGYMDIQRKRHIEQIGSNLSLAVNSMNVYRKSAGFDKESFDMRMAPWCSGTGFPVFSWKADPTLPVMKLAGNDVMPIISQIIMNSLKDYASGLQQYLTAWRKCMIEQKNEDKSKGAIDVIRLWEFVRFQREALDQGYEDDRRKMAELSLKIENAGRGQV